MNRDALILIVALALVGGVAGGAAVLGAGTVARWIARRLGILEARSGKGEGRQMESVRQELLSLRTALNSVLREVSDLSQALRRDRLGGDASPTAAPPSRPGSGEARWREPVQSGQGTHEGSGEPGGSYRPPAPPREPGWRQGPRAGFGGSDVPYRPPSPRSDPWENPGPADWMDRIDARLSREPAHEAFDQPPAGPFDPPADVPAEPAAPRAPAGPPPNAVNVEARDDRIVASSSYPPEAWLEPRGPAVAHLWLNPSVALNENALRRLSTFFQWQGERAGATYDTDTPAILRWDEGQRVGTVTQRGTARPR